MDVCVLGDGGLARYAGAENAVLSDTMFTDIAWRLPTGVRPFPKATVRLRVKLVGDGFVQQGQCSGGSGPPDCLAIGHVREAFASG